MPSAMEPSRKSPPIRTMKKLIKVLPHYHFVNFHQTGADEFVVLLRDDDRFAVCKLQPKRLIAMAPNYQADGHGLLSGPPSPAGLADILQWTDEHEAFARYLVLANLPPNVVPLFPDRRPSG